MRQVHRTVKEVIEVLSCYILALLSACADKPGPSVRHACGEGLQPCPRVGGQLSPILVRPVREQLEHDRVIRLLQAKYKRKCDVAINPGNERTAPVGPAAAPWYPDLVLHASGRSQRLAGVVEVETAESLNNLEAMSQWAAFAKLRVAFHLYVPISGVDAARRLCSDLQIQPAELWAYHTVGDQIRFTAVVRSQPPGERSRGEGAVRRPQADTGRRRTAQPTGTRSARRAAVGAASKSRGSAAKKNAAAGAARGGKRAAPSRSAGARPRKRK